MMRLQNIPACLAVASLVGVFASATFADLPNDVRSSQSADQLKSQIDVYVNAHVGKIVGGEPKSSKESRDELAKQCDTTPVFTPSASFQLVYTTSVATALQPVLKDADVAKRLQAAIVISRLSTSSKLMGLQPSVLVLLQDESPAVALWGLKGAGSLLPSVLAGGFAANNEKLTAAIVKAVETHSTSGPIIQDAYRALDVSGVTPALGAPAIKKTTDAMNALVALRINQWVSGIPVEAKADRDPTNYYWRVVKLNEPKQNLQAVQNLVNLLSVSAQRLATAAPGDRDKIQTVGTYAAGSILNIFNDKPAVVAAFKPFQKLATMSVADTGPALKAAVAELKKLPEYASISEPPQVKPIEQSAAGN